MSIDPLIDSRIADARRTVQLREQQMQAAALTRDSAEISQEEWDGYACRYASAVREWRVLQHIALTQRPAMAQTGTGETWVQQ